MEKRYSAIQEGGKVLFETNDFEEFFLWVGLNTTRANGNRYHMTTGFKVTLHDSQKNN